MSGAAACLIEHELHRLVLVVVVVQQVPSFHDVVPLFFILEGLLQITALQPPAVA